MALLEFLSRRLGGLLDLHVWLIVGPRAIYREIVRLTHPTAQQKAAATTLEMQRFRRNAWIVCLGWLALSAIVANLPNSSFWFGVATLAVGLLFLPAAIETRYERLVAELRPKDIKPYTIAGCFLSVPAARSHPRATWNSVASAKLRPTNWTESGRPETETPAIMASAGWPVTLNGVRAWRG